MREARFDNFGMASQPKFVPTRWELDLRFA